MYSLIFMTAMAGSPEVASFGSGTGCYGAACYGSCYGSVSYSSYTSYSYSSCHGCGGRGMPVLGGLLRGTARLAAAPFRLAGSLCSCHGSSACYGSCYGSTYATYLYSPSYASCFGSCYGSSCYGSCYGSSCVGCFGSCYGSSCFGCTGYAPAYYDPAPVIYEGAPVAVPTVEVPLMSAPAGEHYGTVVLSGATTTAVAAKPTVVVEPGDSPAPASARLAVELPADARLYVDGQLIPGGGETRQFHTPELPRGQAFYYEVKAEVTVNGQTLSEEKRVVVKAGESLRESFPKLVAGVRAAAEPAVASK